MDNLEKLVVHTVYQYHVNNPAGTIVAGTDEVLIDLVEAVGPGNQSAAVADKRPHYEKAG